MYIFEATICVKVLLLCSPLPSSRHHLSNDDCLEDKRENYPNCSVLCCVQLCPMMRSRMYEQFLKFTVVGLELGLVLVFVFFAQVWHFMCGPIVHSAMHTHMNRPNSSLDWVLSHWAHFTVLRFIFVYVLSCVFACMCSIVTW